MKKILFLLVSLLAFYICNAQKYINAAEPDFYDAHTHERAFIKKYTGNNWFFCYYSPIDTVKIPAYTDAGRYGFLHNDSIVIVYFISCGTECYKYFLYVKTTRKYYYFDEVLAIDYKNHILAFIPNPNNTIYFFDYINNDTIKAYTIKNKKFYYFPKYIDTAFFWNNAFYVRWSDFVREPGVELPQFKPGQYSKIATFEQYNASH